MSWPFETSEAFVRGVRAALIVIPKQLFGDEWREGFGDEAYLSSLVRATDAAMDAAERSTTGGQEGEAYERGWRP